MGFNLTSRESSTAAWRCSLAIDRIADHLDEGGDFRIFRNEAVMPMLILRADQHQFETALPDHLAANAREHRTAFAPVGRIGFSPRRIPPVGIGGARAQADQIEHMDGTGPVIFAKPREYFLGGV